MCLIEEEHELGHRQVTHFRKTGIEFCHQPQKESGIEFRIEHELVSSKDTHHALAILRVNQVFHIEGWLTEEFVATFTLNLQHGTLNGADTGWRNVSIDGGEEIGVLSHKIKHETQVLQVNKKELFVIGNAKDDVEDSTLHITQVHQATEQLRSHS